MSFVVAESLAERIAQHISQQIIDGRLPAKQRIQEARVVEELGVSRGSVREALLLLERRHMVDILPRKGAMVSSLDKNSIQGLFDLFGKLLTFQVEKVGLEWEGNQLEPLIKQIQVILSLAGDKDRVRFIGEVFILMRQSYSITDNLYLREILEDLQPPIHRAYFLAQSYVESDKKAAQVFFDGILRAVVDRDIPSISIAVDGYMKHQANLVFQALEAEETKA